MPHHQKLHWAVQQGGIVQWVLTIGGAQGSVNIVQIQKRAFLAPVSPAHVLSALGVCLKKAPIAPGLSGGEGGKIGAPRRYADPRIEPYARVQAKDPPPPTGPPPIPAIPARWRDSGNPLHIRCIPQSDQTPLSKHSGSR